MKKTLTYLITIFCLTIFLNAQIKQQTYDYKVLSDPASPSYVPKPYPQNEKEIIENLMYALKHHYGPGVKTFEAGSKKSIQSRRAARSDKMLGEFATGKSSALTIGEMRKIKHSFYGKTKNYFFQIDLLDSEKNISFTITLDASGLFSCMSTGCHRPIYNVSKKRIEEGFKKVLNEKGIKKR